MRKHPTDKGLRALGAASQVCGEITDNEELVRKRDELWLEAFSEGCTYDVIAEACGLSPYAVRLGVARVQGKPWAGAKT